MTYFVKKYPTLNPCFAACSEFREGIVSTYSYETHTHHFSGNINSFHNSIETDPVVCNSTGISAWIWDFYGLPLRGKGVVFSCV